MTFTIDLRNERAVDAAVALVEGQAAGFELPGACQTAITGIVTAYDAMMAAGKIERAGGPAAVELLSAEITDEIIAAAGRGETIDDPYAPLRALQARSGTVVAELASLRRAWTTWTAAFVLSVTENTDEIADVIGDAIAAIVTEAGPIVDAIADVNLANPEALYTAPKAVQAAFEKARPLAVRQDALRHAAFGLVHTVSGSSANTSIALAYRFRVDEAGLIVEEALGYASHHDGSRTVSSRNFGSVRWAPTGHPIARLIAAVAAARELPAGGPAAKPRGVRGDEAGTPSARPMFARTATSSS